MKLTFAWRALAVGLALVGCSKSDPGRSADPTAAAKALPGKDEPVELKIKWPVGARYVQRMEMTSQNETPVPGRPQPVKQDISLAQEYALAVTKELPEGGRELDMEFLEVEMQVSMGDQVVMNFDSKGEAGGEEANNPVARTFRHLVGAHFQFQLDASNRVQKVTGVKELHEKFGATAQRPARVALDAIFNEDYFKQMVDFSRGLPAGPVKPGDAWPTQFEIAAGPMGKLSLDLQYKFKQWETRGQRPCAAMDFAGTMNPAGEGKPALMGMTMTIDKGTMSGQSWFDPAVGMVVESIIHQKMNMLMNLPAGVGGASAGGGAQTLTNRTDQKINIKLVEFEPGTG